MQPILGWRLDASRLFDAEMMSDETGDAALFALGREMRGDRVGAGTPGDALDYVFLAPLGGGKAYAATI